MFSIIQARECDIGNPIDPFGIAQLFVGSSNMTGRPYNGSLGILLHETAFNPKMR